MPIIRFAFAFFSLPMLLAHTTPVAEEHKSSPQTLFHSKIDLPSGVFKRTVNSTDEYMKWNLKYSGLSRKAFELGIKGYRFFIKYNRLRNASLLTIIDYSQPSSPKRLYVLDMQTQKIVFNTLVAHGQNSGYQIASSFSYEEASHKSSLGFNITMGTYTGANGYSLQLQGCEKGINDNAVNRAIVLHGANYVSEKYVHQNGRQGRSHGCPAVPPEANKKIIDKIRNGSCMFLFHPSKTYINRSKILDS